MPAENPPIVPASLPNYLAEGLPKQNVETLVDTREYIDELIAWNHRPVEVDEHESSPGPTCSSTRT